MKVLVVEDEAIVAQALAALLVSHHYAVDIATDGLEGLEMAEAYSYDLLLLDIGLPGLDGVSLCQQLRNWGLQAPILLLTGQDVEAHAKAVALNAGADDYVTKPFDAEELLARLQTLLRRGDLKALPVLQWGALSLDPSRLQVSYGSALLNLTPKEYTLLEVLLRHAPNILSAAAILEQGWNALENPSDEAIRTHVKEVRKKLKAAGAPDDFIKTVHRQGYRLNPLYDEAAFTAEGESVGTLQMAELKAVNEELRLTLERLRTTQAELQQRNQDLRAARDDLEARVAERTAVLSQQGTHLTEDVKALELLRALSTRFVPNGDLQALYEEILTVAIQLMKADGGTLQILDQSTQDLMLLASVGFDRPMTEHFARVSAQSNTPCGRALARGQRTFVEFDAPASADPDGALRLHREAGYLSAQSTPLISRLGNAIGMLSTHWRSHHQASDSRSVQKATRNEHPQRDRDLWFLDLLARQAADLIEQRQMHLALRQSEEKFRLFVTASSNAVYRMSPDWQEMRRLEGKDFLLSTEAPTCTWLDSYVPPAEQPRVWAAIQKAIRTRRFFELEHQVICQDGTIGWIFSRALPLLNEQGDIVEWLGAASDISDRKRTEANLAFLADIAEDFSRLSTADEIMRAVGAKTGAYLNITNCFFAEIDEGRDQVVINNTWHTADTPDITGVYQLSAFVTEEFRQAGRAGKTMVIRDTQSDPGTDGDRYAALNIRAFIAVPVCQNGEWKYALTVNDSAVRHWREDEIELIREVTNRTFPRLERAWAEAALRQSEDRYRQLVELTPQLVWNANAQGHTYISPQLSEYTGLSPDQLLNFDWSMVIHPDDVDRIRRLWQASLQTGNPYEVEYRLRRADGEYRWHLARAILTDGDQGMQWFGVSIDIHDRKAAETALQASEAKYRSLFSEIDEGYCIAEILLNASGDPVDYRILDANPRFEQLTALPLEVALSGRTLREIAPELEEHWYQIYGHVALTGEPMRFEQQAAGWNRWYEVYAHRIGAPELRQVAILFNDISDRKAAELALQQQIRQEYLLADIAQEIRQSLELDQVLHSTVERVRGWLACDRVIIFRFRPDWQGDVIMESVGDGWTAILSTTIVDPCFADRFVEPFRQGHVSVLSDIHQLGLEPCYVELLQQFQVQASLSVPILQGHGLWGLLIAHHCAAPRQWAAAEIALLKRLSTQAGIAIQQAELYEHIRQELTQRAQMQAVLQESEERFRTLSAAAPVGILQTNADGICLYANAAWQQMSGLSLENSLGNGWLQAIHPDDRAQVFQAWEAYLENQREDQTEFRLLTPAQEIRWISARVATIKSAAAAIVGYVSTYEDITERKRAEQALRASEQRLQTILNHSPAAIYLLDTQNRHLLVNHSYADLLSTTPDSLIGKSTHEVWPAEVADGFVAQNRTVLATGQLLQAEDTVPWGDVTHSYITVKFPLYDATGTLYAICGISTDITERKNLEAQFYQAQRLESLGILAGGIAHDLNNMLTPILTIAQILQLTQKGLNAKGLEQLKLLENSAKRGANLVKQILAVTRTSQGEPTAVDLAALLQEEIEIMRQSLPKAIALQVELPAAEGSQPALGLILADPTYLHQIILNLCINARDAMADGGTLTISATTVFVDDAMAAQNLDAQVGHYAAITVADTGTGIAPEVQERMFDPFFTTKAAGQGTGLGLATVRSLVRANQGFLQVFSEVGQGSQFRVYLPLMADPVAAPALAEQRPVEPASPTTSVNREALILVVEDEDIVRQMLRSLLESQHYQPLMAANGATALEIYRQHQGDIQLVVTDIMMPVLNGLTFIESLRTLNTEIPIIAFSGLPSHADPALASGANYFLNKPFNASALLDLVAIALRQVQ